MKKYLPFLIALIALLVIVGGTILVIRKFAASHEDLAASAEVQAVVAGFGKKLQNVSVLAPADQAAQAIQDNYSPFVAPALLAVWKADPSKAPGRVTSSPWPDRIEVSHIRYAAATKYKVTGKIIELTSNEVEHGGVAATQAISLTVEWINGAWLITAVSVGP